MSRGQRRVLVVNADDLGQSDGINRAVAEAHERGVVTSASLMVRGAAARAAARYARSRPGLSLGLHLDLGEWTLRPGGWEALYEVVPLDDAAAVRGELDRQLETFRELAGRPPTHLDSHQHAHRREPVRTLALEAARRLGVPVRHLTPGVSYCGRFYGQAPDGSPSRDAISVPALIALLAELPAGVTELACHPGHGGDTGTMYSAERAIELRTLCDPSVRAAIEAEGIELRSFSDAFGPPGPAGLPA